MNVKLLEYHTVEQKAMLYLWFKTGRNTNDEKDILVSS
jgi:hypothetical protein